MMALSTGERRAFEKAIHSDGAALVRRVGPGRYEVPSASQAGVRYLVSGAGRELRCTCDAGQRGRSCWHVAAVQLRRTQENARAQAQRMAGERRSVVTLRINDQTFVGTGSSRLAAFANARPVSAVA